MITPEQIGEARHFGASVLSDEELDSLIEHERTHPNPAWLDRLLDLRAARIARHVNEAREASWLHAVGLIEAAEQRGLRAPAWCYEEVNPAWVASIFGSLS